MGFHHAPAKLEEKRRTPPSSEIGCFLLFKFIIFRCTVFLTRNALHEWQRAWRGTELSKHFKEDSPMAWLFLLVPGLCEVSWVICLNYSEGFSLLLPTIRTVSALSAT